MDDRRTIVQCEQSHETYRCVITLHWQFFAHARMYVARMDVHLCSGIKCMFFFLLCIHLCIRAEYIRMYSYDVNVAYAMVFASCRRACNAAPRFLNSLIFFNFSLILTSFSILSFVLFNSYYSTLKRPAAKPRRSSACIVKYTYIFSFLFRLIYNAIGMWRMLKITIYIFILLF